MTQSKEPLRVFTGEYRHTVDDKGRIAVPAKFRAQLGAGAVVSRWLDACLAIHTQAGWDELAAKVAALPITNEASRRFQRFVFAGAAEVELDRQGRILLPAYLRDHIGLGQRGRGRRLARSRGDLGPGHVGRPTARTLDDPQELAQAFEGLGI